MGVKETFDTWFKDLPSEGQREVLEHVTSITFRKRIIEGYYGGPANPFQRGFFAGPASSTSVCPTCGKPY